MFLSALQVVVRFDLSFPVESATLASLKVGQASTRFAFFWLPLEAGLDFWFGLGLKNCQ